MGRRYWPSAGALQAALFLLLLSTASSFSFSRKKGREEKAKAAAHHQAVTPHKLPPSTFVRIFALPSFEAKHAQHRLGELLAAACKNHARVGGCKLYSVAVEGHHIRVLSFEEGNKNSTIAYMLQDNEEEAEKALQDCAAKHSQAATQENGKDYRCYSQNAKLLPSRDEVVKAMKTELEAAGLYERLAAAPLKSIFLSADPKQIIYQESIRLVKDNGDPDFFLQMIRDSFRRIVEWLSWQFQQFSTLAEGGPVLVSHAEDIDNSEKDEIRRILSFLDLEDLHVVQETVTATRGEVRFQKERLRAEILSLPRPLIADIDEFMVETLQDKRMLERYVGPHRDRATLWPDPNSLQSLAVDNTLLVTAATCSYAPLIINWIKTVHTLGVPCYLVVALDDEIYRFLHNWLPEHVVRAPPGFIPAVPRQYASHGTPEMRHVSRARLATLKAITDQAGPLMHFLSASIKSNSQQGYNTAWLDADAALTDNPFATFSRWFDLVATWSGGDDEPLQKIEKVVGYELKFTKPGPSRKISPSFLFMRGTEAAQAFLEHWSTSMNSSHATDDGALFNKLLHEAEVNKALSIQLLPESRFPTGKHLFSNASAAYQKQWESSPAAWAHPDSVTQRHEKIQLLESRNLWKVDGSDPMPRCARTEETFLSDGTVVPVWPPAKMLSGLEQDGTVLVTSGTCAYADLLTNWIKHVYDLQIKCFFVASADESTDQFLRDWVPEHTSRIPAKLVTEVKKYAQKATPEYTRVTRSKPVVLRALLEQGYNAAWSDADVAWVRNPFTLFDKSADIVVAWADNTVVTPGVVMRPKQFPGTDGRKIGSAFVFVKPGSLTLELMNRWAQKLQSSSYVDDAAALHELLLLPEFKNGLTIGILPSACFPTGAESTASPPVEALKDAWEAPEMKPAWLHADSAPGHESKVKLLKAQSQWRVNDMDPQPVCKTWGRKLGAGAGEEGEVEEEEEDRDRVIRTLVDPGML